MTDPASRRRSARGRVSTGMARLTIILVVGAAVVAAIVFDRTGPESDRASADPPTDAPSVPRADALSASWYCAEGTAAADERADETVLLANLGDDDAEALVTVYDAREGDPEPERVEVPAGEQVAVDITDLTDEPEMLLLTRALVGPGAVVEVFGGQVVVEHAVRSGDDLAVGPCARGAGTEWLFAAGTTVRGTELMLSLFNPFGDDAIVDLTFLTDAGVQSPEGGEALSVPRHTRVTIPVHDLVQRQAEVATSVSARTGRVVAEQLLTSDGSEIPAGLGLSLGAAAPADSWAFPYGFVSAGRTHAVSVANFADTGTEVEVSVALGDAGADGEGEGEGDAGAVEPQTVPIGPRSVSVVDVGGFVPVGTPYAVEVRAVGAGPVVAEELVTAEGDTEGGLALDLGTAEPARRWVFTAPGDAEAGVIIVAFNPGPTAATASLLTLSGGELDPVGGSEVSIPPGRRASFVLDDLEIDTESVVVLDAGRPVVAERLVGIEGGRSLSAGVPDLGR
ncbi:MAG TPA: DUF5719 family protein [Acidimicrobiia bacterium]